MRSAAFVIALAGAIVQHEAGHFGTVNFPNSCAAAVQPVAKKPRAKVN